MPADLESSAVAIGLEKVSFHSNPKERQCQRMLKLPHNCIHLTHQQSNAKIIQARLQQYVTVKFQIFKLDLEGRGTRDEIGNIHWIMEKNKRVPENYLLLLYWLHQSL